MCRAVRFDHYKNNVYSPEVFEEQESYKFFEDFD
jgi:hypothetical protein